MDFLVEILLSCCGRGGCRWHFLTPFNLRHSPCGFLYNHLCLSANDTVTSLVILPVMAGDCGDEIPSKSKPQSAGVMSCANFENVLRVRYLQISSFRFYCIFREFRECSQCFFHFVDVLLIFANPDNLCGNFFFFLNGSSFPSASTLSRNCSSAAPPRYCFPEISLPIELLAV